VENTDFQGMWSDLISKMVEAGGSFSTDQSPPEALRQSRSVLFDAWAELWQQWAHTPEFLQLLKQTMGMNFQMRKQMNDFWGQLRHQSQGTSRQDFDQLMRAMRHLERRLADTSERIFGRLEDIEDRLDSSVADQSSDAPTHERRVRRHRVRLGSPRPRNRGRGVGGEGES